jgi:capsular polysaccharide transport system permease protein
MSALLASSFGRALGCQSRVVGALILREMRVRFGRSQLGYLWAVAEPLGYLVGFSAMYHYLDRHPPFGNSMVLFFSTGILPFQLFRHIGNQLSGAFSANQALLTYPIVQPIDTVIARAILEIATSLFVMIIVFGAIIITGNAQMPDNVVRLVESVVLLSLLAFGYGLMSAVIITRINSWHNISRLIMTPMMFLSGIFFSLDSVPLKFRDIVTWNPVLHGVEMFREGYYSNYRGSEIDPFYLAVCAIVLTFVALAMERTVRGRIE